MYKANFKTAYLQREVVVDCVVGGTNPLHVGELVTAAFAPNGTAYLAATSGNTVSEAVAKVTHIVAQSDQTMEYGHIPVENRDYKYDDGVAVTSGVLTYFDGAYESVEEAKKYLGNGTNTHVIAVKQSGKYYRATSSGTAWTVSTTELPVKKVALFAVSDTSDLNAYDAEA